MIILIMNKLKSKINKKVLFKMKVFQLSRVKLANCVDKNILRSAVARNDCTAVCSGEKKVGR